MRCARPYFGGGKNAGLAGSDPPLRGSLPANFAALLLPRAQHYFMQVLPPPLRRPATKNLVITRTEKRLQSETKDLQTQKWPLSYLGTPGPGRGHLVNAGA